MPGTFFFFLNPLKEFWYGFNYAGSLNKRVAIVGFSLPEHDDYIRQPIYELVTNFQKFDPEIDTLKKVPLKMVDYRTNDTSERQYKENYRFVEWDTAEYTFDGFSEEAVDFIFS